MVKRALCTIGVDVDAVAGWLGSYGGEDSPNDVSSSEFNSQLEIISNLNLSAIIC